MIHTENKALLAENEMLTEEIARVKKMLIEKGRIVMEKE